MHGQHSKSEKPENGAGGQNKGNDVSKLLSNPNIALRVLSRALSADNQEDKTGYDNSCCYTSHELGKKKKDGGQQDGWLLDKKRGVRGLPFVFSNPSARSPPYGYICSQSLGTKLVSLDIVL